MQKRGFYDFGKNSVIKPVLNTTNKQNISIGSNVNIGSFCWVAVSTDFAGIHCQSPNKVRLMIGDNTSIGNNAFVIANNYVEISRNVIISNYVYISDHHHTFNNMEIPITEQPLSEGGRVIIKDNVFIGTKSCILPNVTIGERSVIGAGSIVTKDIEPYHMVVGNPAKPIKKYDCTLKKWISLL